MTVSKKQLDANRENAQLGGVKTDEGKAIVKYNALKHGLLAKEIVITVGDGAESTEEFNTLLDDLQSQLKPEGALEELLVEKIAVAYWRLRRACRYEAGLIRDKLDDAITDFYENTDYCGQKITKTDEEIDQDITKEQEAIDEWEKDKKRLTSMLKEGKSLEKIYEWEGNWDWLTTKICDVLSDIDEENPPEPKKMREMLNTEAGWSDEQIWQAHIDLCDERITYHIKEIAALKNEIEKNRLRLEVIKKLGSIPSKEELDRLLRYESAIERQLYKAMNQLERLQRMRSGESVPAPIAADVDLNIGQGS